MRILVAGGAGFIGSHLVDRLVEQKHTVVVADNFVTGRYTNLEHLDEDPHLRILHQDLTQPLDQELFAERYDQVYNLASPAAPTGYGRHPIATHLVNSFGTYSLLELARRDRATFLQASTSEVYGDPQVHPQSEDYWGNVNPIGPRSCYDEGKRFSESLTMDFFRQFGVDVRIARIFNTYGPRSDPKDGRVVPNFCVQALTGAPLTIYGDGTQTRSFCYVDDLVRGLQRLMETDGLAGEVVNIGNPEEYTVQQFADEVLAVTNSTSAIEKVALPVDDPTRRKPDIGKAQRVLDWRPEVGLRDGLKRTVEYFAVALEVRVG